MGMELLQPGEEGAGTASSQLPFKKVTLEEIVKNPGALSQKYEVPVRDPATVSSGEGDLGGASYGLPQFPSSKGAANLKQFIAASKFKEQFKGLKPATPEFNEAWKNVALNHPEAFAREQEEFNKKLNFEPALKSFQKASGIDPNKRSPILQAAIYSAATQHGPTGQAKLWSRVKAEAQKAGTDITKLDDKGLLNMFYQTKNDLVDKSFKSSSLDVRNNIRKRIASEHQDIQNLFSEYDKVKEEYPFRWEPGIEKNDMVAKMTQLTKDPIDHVEAQTPFFPEVRQMLPDYYKSKVLQGQEQKQAEIWRMQHLYKNDPKGLERAQQTVIDVATDTGKYTQRLGGKQPVARYYSKLRNQTKVVYNDGTTEIIDGKP